MTSRTEIPKDWAVIKLQEIFKLKNGERPEFSECGKYFVYGANGIMGLSDDFLVDNDFTIIFGRVGASGEIHIARGKIWVSDNAIYTQDYDRKKIYPYFVYYLLKWKNIGQFATKTTHPIITQSFLNSFRIYLPPLPEQKAIAKILSTVDEAIQKIDEAIAKTERLKKGLMQKLLTKGIGHKEFKYSKELGCEIPKEWKSTTIGEKCIVGTGGTPNRNKPEYFGGKIPWVKSTEVNYNIIRRTEETLTPLGLKNSNAKIYPAGTLIIAMYGQGATRGKCAILGIDAAVNQACAAVIPRYKNTIYIPYLYYWCQFKYKRIRKLGQGANQSNLNLLLIRSIKIPLPPLPEQQKIAEILSTVDKKLELERKRKEKLERIKKGLMNDLLTGRKRVRLSDWKI